jgi:hypothetical protein
MKFRSVQAVTFGTMFGYWVVRLVTHPNHLHLSMLVMGAVALAISELGYRAGKKEAADKEDKRVLVSNR